MGKILWSKVALHALVHMVIYDGAHLLLALPTTKARRILCLDSL